MVISALPPVVRLLVHLNFSVPSTGARTNAGSVAGFDASVMHPLVWDENSFVPRVLGVAGSSMPSVGSLVPVLVLVPVCWIRTVGLLWVLWRLQRLLLRVLLLVLRPVLPDSLVGVSTASGVVLGSTGFEVLGAPRGGFACGSLYPRLILVLRL